MLSGKVVDACSMIAVNRYMDRNMEGKDYRIMGHMGKWYLIRWRFSV